MRRILVVLSVTAMLMAMLGVYALPAFAKSNPCTTGDICSRGGSGGNAVDDGTGTLLTGGRGGYFFVDGQNITSSGGSGGFSTGPGEGDSTGPGGGGRHCDEVNLATAPEGCVGGGSG